MFFEYHERIRGGTGPSGLLQTRSRALCFSEILRCGVTGFSSPFKALKQPELRGEMTGPMIYLDVPGS